MPISDIRLHNPAPSFAGITAGLGGLPRRGKIEVSINCAVGARDGTHRAYRNAVFAGAHGLTGEHVPSACLIMTKAPEAHVQLVARVMEAITHGWEPGLGTFVLAEYVGRNAEAEISALVKTRRRPRRARPRR